MANPILAAILSLIIPGLGQIYAGSFLRGVLIFIGVIALGAIFYYVRTVTASSAISLVIAAIGLIVIIAYVYDAYNLAKKTA